MLGYGATDTTTVKSKSVVMENHVSRGGTFASYPKTTSHMKSVLDHSQSSVNHRSGSINSDTCVTPTMATEDIDSEGMCYRADI